jgi:hypothetical protein
MTSRKCIPSDVTDQGFFSVGKIMRNPNDYLSSLRIFTNGFTFRSNRRSYFSSIHDIGWPRSPARDGKPTMSPASRVWSLRLQTLALACVLPVGPQGIALDPALANAFLVHRFAFVHLGEHLAMRWGPAVCAIVSLTVALAAAFALNRWFETSLWTAIPRWHVRFSEASIKRESRTRPIRLPIGSMK